MINKTFNRYYSKNDSKEKKLEDKIKNNWLQETQEILMPFDLFTSKVQESIDFMITRTNFRNRHMRKIEKHIDIISKLLYEDKKDAEYVAKWMRIPWKIFIKWLKTYLEWIRNKSSKSLIETKDKIERF